MASDNPYASPDAEVEVDDSVQSELAGRWRRLGGSLIDGILLMIVWFPIMMVAGIWDRMMDVQATFSDTLVSTVLGIGLFLLLNGYLLMTSGQTLAKRTLGMRIVSVADDKILPIGKLIVLRYLPQWVLAQLPVVGGFVGLVDSLFIFGEERRCAHDYIAGTKVVLTKD